MGKKQKWKKYTELVDYFVCVRGFFHVQTLLHTTLFNSFFYILWASISILNEILLNSKKHTWGWMVSSNNFDLEWDKTTYYYLTVKVKEGWMISSENTLLRTPETLLGLKTF